MTTSYREIFESVKSGKSDKQFVLIENSRHGTNYEVYDLFYEYKNISAVGELNKKNINDNSFDRFIMISKKPIVKEKANKSSMMFVVSHKPGSLYRALSVFENYELN